MMNYKDAEWLQAEYVEKDRTQESLAEECGVSRMTIYRWRKKFDIQKPETAQFGMQTDDYEQWKCEVGAGSADSVTVHRLLATLKVDDLAELDGKHVHHANRIPWDNRLENLEVVSPEEHGKIHAGNGQVEMTA